jgi:hypothetical protein
VPLDLWFCPAQEVPVVSQTRCAQLSNEEKKPAQAGLIQTGSKKLLVPVETVDRQSGIALDPIELDSPST